MYREYETMWGIPDRIYRSPLEIKRQINSVKLKISEINERLNVRTLLLDMADRARCDEGEPSYWIPELSEALREAEAAYGELVMLRGELDALREELEETVCAIR